MARLFIGISIPNEVKAKVVALRKKVEALGMDCKFVEDENLHISVSFLGEVDEKDLDSITNNMNDVSGGFKKFEVIVGKLKAIPSVKYARVLAFDVNDDGDLLRELSSQVKKSVGGDVKPPHLTLCRLRERADEKAIAKIVDIDLAAKFEVKSIILFQSHLSNKGPKYTVLHESSLT